MQGNIDLTISQNAAISARLQQALNILQYSNAKLMLEIETALDHNYILEKEVTDSDSLLGLDDSFISQNYDSNHKSDNKLTKEYTDFLSNKVNLQEYLNWQLNLSTYSDIDIKIGQTIIDALDDNGYLYLSINDIKNSLKQNFNISVNNQDILVVLHYIQNLEPSGIAARSVKECLMLQLTNMPYNTPWLKEATIIVEKYLDLLAKNNYSVLTKKMSVSMQQLQAVIALIKRLNPKPGLMINSATENFITPELILKQENGEWDVILGSNCANVLRLSDNYKNLLKSANNEQEHKMIKSMYYDARFLIKCIEDRNSTMLKVARSIFKHQQEFLNYGECKIKSLNLKVIAEELKLNISTISRAISDKYISTPYGSFALKHFFSSSINNGSSTSISSREVIYKLKDIIDNEDNTKPLTDEQLVQNLAKNGIVVARRTVAKYRGSLGIASANWRIKKEL